MVISTISIAISPPRFIDAPRAFKMGSRTESCPVVHGGPGDAFRRPRACRCRLGAGDEDVRFVASTFSNVRSSECEMLASGVDGISLVRSLSGGTWASAAGARTSLHPTPVNGRPTAQPNRHIDQPASPRTMRAGGEPAIPPGPVRALRASVRCGGGRVQSRGERPIERPGCGW
jgi:hypothetical protein